MNATIHTNTEHYWVQLIQSEIKMVQGQYSTRVLEAGNPHHPALFLLHGTGGHLENYARNIAPLSQHFRVIALDFLWHGRSQTTGFNHEVIPSLIEQILDVMQQLNIPRAHFEGQSMGGWVAMQLALQHPDKVDRLILTTTMGYRPDPHNLPEYTEPNWAANLPSSLEVLEQPSFEHVRQRMARILANPERLTSEAIQVRQALYLQPALAAVQKQFITEYLSGKTIQKHIVTDDLAQKIQAPTLVYWGDQNRTPPLLGQHIADQLQHGQFFCAQDTGHWAQFESAETHNQVVTEFLLSESHLSPSKTSKNKDTKMSDVDLTGRWELVTFAQNYDDGRQVLPMGDAPQGVIQYTKDGFMSCMICRPDRQHFTTGGQWNASDAEKAQAYNSMMSYAGRYSIENNTVTHFVDLSLFPNWIGGQQKRSFQVDEQGRLSLTARLEENTSEARTALLLWKRN
jgi:2-hydroxy-6-oxonona-2,4-dienedioate hydrolase